MTNSAQQFDVTGSKGQVIASFKVKKEMKQQPQEIIVKVEKTVYKGGLYDIVYNFYCEDVNFDESFQRNSLNGFYEPLYIKKTYKNVSELKREVKRMLKEENPNSIVKFSKVEVY